MQVYQGTTGGVTATFNVKLAPAVVVGTGFATTETAVLQVYNGVGWQDFLDAANAQIKLSATVKNIPVAYPGTYRLNVSVTAASATIVTYRNE